MEPKWNVKADVDLFHHTLEAGINGTKVECKVFLFQFFKRDLSVLMEPKWNVKRERIQETVPSSGVLM